jgi:hypothetical protein
LEGRVFRKKTRPSLPFTGKRPSIEESPVPKKVALVDVAIKVEMVPATPTVGYSPVDVCTQTSPKKRVLVTKTTKTYRQGETNVEVVTKEKVIFK